MSVYITIAYLCTSVFPDLFFWTSADRVYLSYISNFNLVLAVAGFCIVYTFAQCSFHSQPFTIFKPGFRNNILKFYATVPPTRFILHRFAEGQKDGLHQFAAGYKFAMLTERTCKTHAY